MLVVDNNLEQLYQNRTEILEKLSFTWTRSVKIDVKKIKLSADDKYGIIKIWHDNFDENDVSTSAAHFAKQHGLNKKTFHH